MAFWEDRIRESAQAVKAADREARRSQLAFLSGRFDEYWQSKADENARWIEDQYAELNDSSGQTTDSGDSETDGGSGSGTSGSGEGGSVEGSPSDAQ